MSPEPTDAAAVAPVEAPTESYVGALGIELWAEGDRTHGRVEVHPELCAPGTGRMRVGVLATIVDIGAGTPPSGPINPTVDLRIQLLRPVPPPGGEIRIVTDVLKAGRRLFVGETLLRSLHDDEPFARAVSTFMNQPIDPDGPSFRPRPRTPLRGRNLDDLLGIRDAGPGTVEMRPLEAVRNGFYGTIQGGAQTVLAEVAVERVLAARGRFEVVDLDVKYLNRLSVGPLSATPVVVGDDGDEVVARVPLVDAGADGRLVSFVTVVARRA